MNIINMTEEQKSLISKITVGGYYRHYKGNLYQICGWGIHTETEEIMVTYRSIGKNEDILWIRPLTMWLENVIINGEEVPRFRYEGNSYLNIMEKEREKKHGSNS